MTLYRIYYHSVEERLPISELDIHPDILHTLDELGMLEISGGTIGSKDLRRLYQIMRIKNFLGVNLNGASIIVNLMERIEELEEELDQIKRRR